MSEDDVVYPGKTIKFIVFAWVVILFIALMYFTTERLVDFDPDSKLLDSSTDPEYFARLKSTLKSRYASVKSRAFHISDENCFCQMIAGAHISDVSDIVVEETMENVSVALDEVPEIADYLPSVPAIILYNDREQLLYIGPYSTGYLCTTGNGLVEDLIPRMNEPVERSVVMSLARGCYCNL